MTNALIYSIAWQSHIPKRMQMNIFETVRENVGVKNEWGKGVRETAVK